MTLSERTRLFDLRINFEPDGTYAAAQTHVREIMDGDTVIATQGIGPEALAAEDVAAVIGEAVVAITIQRDALLAQVADLQTQITDLQTQNAALQNPEPPVDGGQS